MILRALEFAAQKHRDQRRKDTAQSAYINHPIALTRTLWDAGRVRDPKVLAAALLHDTVEDTDTSFAELEREFGADIGALVAEMSDDKRLPKERRKELQIRHAPGLSQRAKLLKIADKICNVRDVTHNPPASWPLERRREYLNWSERVIAGCRGVNPRLEQVFERVLEEGRKLLGD